MQVAPHARMNAARAAHTATGLAGERVLIAGGCTRAGCEGTTASAELYDPASAAFLSTGSMTVGRVSHAATLLADGTVLVTGGWTGGATTASSELYDPVQGRFTAHADMLRARAAHRAIALRDGRVLVIGGEAATGSALASAEVYDPSTARFDAGGEMLLARTNHSATLLRDGRILVAGGRQSRRSVTATAEIFDPVTGESRATGAMALPREKHEAVLLTDGRVLVVGGADAQETRHATTEIYDPEQGLFTAGPPMRSPRYKLAGSVVVTDAGHVVVTGGAAAVEWLSTEHGTGFGVAGRMDGPREFTSAIVRSDGTILVVGGYDERIRPSASTWTVTLPVDRRSGPAAGAALPDPAREDDGLGVVGFSQPGAGTIPIRARPDPATAVIAELRRPHDGPSVCAGEPSVLDTAVWIRYLDDRGRPLVRAMTRGC